MAGGRWPSYLEALEEFAAKVEPQGVKVKIYKMEEAWKKWFMAVSALCWGAQSASLSGLEKGRGLILLAPKTFMRASQNPVVRTHFISHPKKVGDGGSRGLNVA